MKKAENSEPSSIPYGFDEFLDFSFQPTTAALGSGATLSFHTAVQSHSRSELSALLTISILSAQVSTVSHQPAHFLSFLTIVVLPQNLHISKRVAPQDYHVPLTTCPASIHSLS
jgi:hypothetical protein